MKPRTRPLVRSRMGYHLCLHWISFYITCCRYKVLLIKNAGPEPALEQVAANPFLKVSHPGVPSMGLPKCLGKGGRISRDSYKMDMVRHEAPGKELYTEASRLIRKKLPIGQA